VSARFPRRVYGVGAEPDPRFTLANERTFLAWIRTSLALSAAGVALVAVDVPMSHALQVACALTLVVMGLVAPVQAWTRWMATERSLRLARALPAFAAGPLLTSGVALAGVLLVIGVVLG
jgi:putative membrane protein